MDNYGGCTGQLDYIQNTVTYKHLRSSLNGSDTKWG